MTAPEKAGKVVSATRAPSLDACRLLHGFVSFRVLPRLVAFFPCPPRIFTTNLIFQLTRPNPTQPKPNLTYPNPTLT